MASLIRRSIESGELRPGDRIPSEWTLAQTHGIARETARRAVTQLRLEGLVETVRGRGVIVREEVPRDQVRLRRGSRLSVRVATPAERERLGLEPGDRVIVVRYQRDLPEVYPEQTDFYNT